MKNKVKLPERDSDGQLPSYAWPGGYTLIYITKQGNTLCAACATMQEDDPDKTPYDDEVTGYDIYYEGPDVQCDECGKVLESSYGDPDSKVMVITADAANYHVECAKEIYGAAAIERVLRGDGAPSYYDHGASTAPDWPKDREGNFITASEENGYSESCSKCLCKIVGTGESDDSDD